MATISSIQASKAAERNTKLNARLANQDAIAQAQVVERQAQQSANAIQQEEQALAFDVRNEQRRIDALLAQQRQAIGASGFEFTGSPLLIAVETAREEAIGLEALRFQTRQRQQALRDEQRLQEFQATELRTRGVSQLKIGSFRARTIRQLGRVEAAGVALQGAASVTGTAATATVGGGGAA
ncbi:MAG: hypothetical protein L0177_13085 [Chloroflexi bacterium]|nr:hypothetical protein [Chloroflexota bacterium]